MFLFVAKILQTMLCAIGNKVFDIVLDRLYQSNRLFFRDIHLVLMRWWNEVDILTVVQQYVDGQQLCNMILLP